MKSTKIITLLLFISITLWACEKDDDKKDEEDRTTQSIALINRTGLGGCGFEEPGGTYSANFLLTFDGGDRQVSADVSPEGNLSIVTVSVTDNETINVQVRRLADDVLVSDANVNIRTDSRPEGLGPREIKFCRAFDLQFENF